MRRGFTLIELLVAIILFSLIAAFLYGGIDQVRLMRLFYDEKGKEFKHHERIRSLLYRDLAQAEKMSIIDGDSDHSIVSLQPDRHSLYGIALPNVVWLVVRKNNTLIRLESAENIQIPLDPTKFYGVHSDIVATGCTTFRVYESSAGRFGSLTCGNDEIMVEAPR
ncbi:MAG: prepilin-type N-terminal cleavage/methylation domain-containing protein [Sulfuricurvum sp.]|uniref:PulJ/GspJ family protein n=1 Tax=Sulfuricurvum sp. TaxID=2025608 RepID=UPI002623B9A2|nr:prepilin-type N-terminal cleavage/methylation domain-containing protein [Sulfuricurvum sp.]MDD2949572.1 prepilin-type N-terminal cleavage/methylation domain-containing protein [Sulfuricurvum sp.]MDD5119137.1 prepilin-type N-terminal cleavage/methylation domain-containing protein [Sulfuricurvum sp.]